MSMQQATILIHHDSGLHARPAAQFVKLAKQFKSDITVTNNGKTVNAKSIMFILTLGISKNTEIVLTANGEDEQEAVSVLVALVENNFPE
jgi:phosphocarrier protein HPr